MLNRGTIVAAALFALSGTLCGCSPSFETDKAVEARTRTVSAWPEYGGGGGRRFVDLAQITPANVAELKLAWSYRTGDVADGSDPAIPSTTAFEVTPIVAEGQLVFCSPFNRVIALDPLTGGELWTFDPAIDRTGRYANQLVCRGVAYWRGPESTSPRPNCTSRIFTATNDGFLIAIDARDGSVCTDFGAEGRVDLNRGVGGQQWLGEYQITSPPTVISNLVVVGAAIADNVRTDAPSGVIRAFDALSGRQVWAWDLAPPGFDYDHGMVSDEGFALGTPNVWGPMTADPGRNLIFVPTGNPSPDYYRDDSPAMDYYGSSVVALNASTGSVVWHFNTVIHDFWDYDVGAQPTLAELTVDGRFVPAVIQGTKMGFIFVLHRETGEPLVDVEYQSVPREGPLTEQLSPVQPMPPPAFRLAPVVSPADAWGISPIDRNQCRDLLTAIRTGPIYTPITEEWTAVAPSNAGGINWGGVAVDERRGVVLARSTNLPFQVRLIPRDSFAEARGAEFGPELAEQRGAPYGMARQPLLSKLGLPCTRPPWGLVTAVDLNSGRQLWQKPHGTVRDISPVPLPVALGVPGLGAPIVTASGLVFLGAAWENVLRAYDLDDGRELWRHDLPAGPQATPMSYSVSLEDGTSKQFVVIAAGGHGTLGSDLGDYLVAFALP